MHHSPINNLAKHHLRKEALALRAQLPMDTISNQIRQHLQNWMIFQAARQILFYYPFRNEVDILPLVSLFPEKKWALPVVASDGCLAFYRYAPLAPIETGKYGICEPSSRTEPIDRLTPTDLLIAPGLLFDHQGYRLGYGKGYYDKFLSGLAQKGTLCTLVGVVPQALLHRALPHDDWDIPMHVVATETGIQASQL